MMRFRRVIAICSIAVGGCAIGPVALASHAQPVPVRPEFRRTAEISLWKADFSTRARFQSFSATQFHGGYLASGDVTDDEKPEIIIGAGEGETPEVRVYTTEGKLLKTFDAYAKTFLGGVRVSVGDLNGDGKAEIVTAPGSGMEPMVRRFSGDGSFVAPNGFLAYAKEFQGGVHVTVGDLNGDGKAEIVTTPGPGGGPHVRIFDGTFQNFGFDFFAFPDEMRDGVVPTILRTPEGFAIAVGIESWSEPIVKLFRKSFDGTYIPYFEFLAFDRGWRSGASVAAFDVNGDGFDEIAVHGNGGTSADLRIFTRTGALLGKYLVQDPGYRGGLSVAQIDMVRDGKPELATVALAPVVSGPLTQEKAIHVNLTEQRLYAYERGRIARTFLVSTGTWKHPTPTMETWVREKVLVKRYKWNYGVGNPDNYDLPNVKWNLQIFGPFFIHGAYWHHNFGHRMSHGCINVSYPNAEWIYGWAEVEIPVRTFYTHPPQNESSKAPTSKIP